MPSRKAKFKALLTHLAILTETANILDPEKGGLSVAARIQIATLRAHLSGQALTVKALALEVGVSVTTLRGYLIALVDADLIMRSASEHDARSVLVRPTQRLLNRADLIFELGGWRSGPIAQSLIASPSRTSNR